MSNEGDRRAPGTSRVPFDALVEVGAELGPAFEAQAIDISEDGMHLRTAYLPEVGQPLSFRFDAGPGKQVVCGAEVTWTHELGKGGEFGVRFMNLDGESVAALGRILGLGGPAVAVPPGARVRLHIDGLGSPMRARVKESSGEEITAYSELGFLRVGKRLNLEDAQTGKKRPASIDRVEVEVDAQSLVPHLVVTLRYDDASAQVEAAPVAAEAEGARETDPGAREATTEPTPHDPAHVEDGAEESQLEAQAHAATQSPPPESEDVSFEEASGKMKGAIARGAAQVGPAMAQMMKRAKVTIALLAAKRQARLKDAAPLRRTTAPPPGGALHAAGRKVVRSEPDGDAKPEPPQPKALVTPRRVAAVGAVGAALVLGAVALHKPAQPPPLASAPPPETSGALATNALPAASPDLAAPPASPSPMAATPVAPPDPMSLSPAAADEREVHAPKKIHVAPFGNGPVAHGNVLKLKMDGAIEKIEGAGQPTGFTVLVPNRKSLEAAGPLAARDGRIASIRVSNDPSGAELSVAFKDGVPNYQVRARGDTLEIALAPMGAVADARPAGHAQAKHNDAGTKPHGKAHHSEHGKKD